jgi:hypothetical protein
MAPQPPRCSKRLISCALERPLSRRSSAGHWRCAPDGATTFAASARLIVPRANLTATSARACSRRSLRRARPALVIGTCPAMAAEHLRAAAEALRAGTDAVVVPAEDGDAFIAREPQPVFPAWIDTARRHGRNTASGSALGLAG